MSIWNQYPYTDFHELNLDWIIKMVKVVTKEMNDFKVVNSIVWGGLHDPGKEYPRWCIVDTPTHEGYISIQPVPTGITIDNEDYWRQVANYSALYADFQNRVIALENTVNELSSRVFDLSNKRILIIGDSISDEVNYPNCWVKWFRDDCAAKYDNVYIDTFAINGYMLSSNGGMTGIAEQFVARAIDPDGYDYIIIETGLNDWGGQINIGYFTSTNYADFRGALNNLVSHIKTYYGTSKVFWLTPPPTFLDSAITDLRHTVLNAYRNTILKAANQNKHYVIDGACGVANYNDSLTLDHIHPNADGAKLLEKLIIENLECPKTDVGDVWQNMTWSNPNGTTGSFTIYTNCHGEIIFDVNISLSTAQAVNANFEIAEDTCVGNAAGDGLVFLPIGWQGTNQLVAMVEIAGNHLYLSVPENAVGRWIGSVTYNGNKQQIPTKQ